MFQKSIGTLFGLLTCLGLISVKAQVAVKSRAQLVGKVMDADTRQP